MTVIWSIICVHVVVTVLFSSAKRMEKVLRTLDLAEDDVLQRIQAAREGRLSEKPPQYMLTVYNKYSSLADGIQRTVVAFFDKGSGRSNGNASQQRFAFQLPSGGNNTTVTRIRSARLRLHVAEGLSHKSQRYRIKVYVESRISKRSRCGYKTAARTSGQWLQVEVGGCVDEWIRSDEKHQSIDFIVQAERIHPKSVPIPVRFSNGGRSDCRALLVLFEEDRSQQGIMKSDRSQTQPSAHHREARRAGRSKKRQGRNNGLCRRRSLYVNFKDVGWDTWVIAPEGYDAHYCKGVCPWPLSDQFNSSTHAIVQSTLRESGRKSVPPVCCVPTKLRSISLLYFDSHGDVVFKQRYRDMAVESCGCR